MADRTISHYELKRLLGEGAMGKVYLARDVVLDRPVAIKLIVPKNLSDPTFLDRFKREARLAGQLNHPNIATVYEYGEEQGEAFLAMEFVNGTTLSDLLKGGVLSVDLVCKWGAQAASALAAAHKRGIVHRDIKAANLMINEDGDLKVMDFGVARSSSETQLTMDGQLIGTANIMAPEIVQGHQAVTQSDLFSLGCVLFEALCGRSPFPGDDAMSVLYQVVHQEPKRIDEKRPDAPPELVTLIHGMLSKDPETRFGPADKVASALRGELVTFGGEEAAAAADVTMVQGSQAADTTMSLKKVESGKTTSLRIPGTGVGQVMGTGTATATATHVPSGDATTIGPAPRGRNWWLPLIVVVVLGMVGITWMMTKGGGGSSGNRDLAVTFNEEAVALITENRNVLAARPEVADEIIDLLIKSTNADPSYVDAWNNMGVVFLESGKTRMAESHLKRGVEAHPKSAALHGHLAEVQAANGSAEAEASYARSIELDANPIYRNNYGYWLVEQRRFDDALKVLDAAWASFPAAGVPDSLKHVALGVRKNRGLAELGLGENDRAEADLAWVTAQEPKWMPGWIVYARIAEARGDIKAAGMRWARLGLDPAYKDSLDAWLERRKALQND